MISILKHTEVSWQSGSNPCCPNCLVRKEVAPRCSIHQSHFSSFLWHLESTLRNSSRCPRGIISSNWSQPSVKLLLDTIGPLRFSHLILRIQVCSMTWVIILLCFLVIPSLLSTSCFHCTPAASGDLICLRCRPWTPIQIAHSRLF